MPYALCLPQSAIQTPFSTLAKVSAIFAAVKLQHSQFLHRMSLARIFHELPAATTDVGVLPGVLVCRSLQRTVEVRLGTNTLRLPGGTPIFAVSRQQFMKYPG